MAIQYNTSIVKNGLVLNYDAANQKSSALTNVEVLVVAGGGAAGGYGGNDGSGGGGAGGLIYNSSYAVVPGAAISVTVGNGGAGVGGSLRGNNGENSVFGTLTAIGGGGGGTEGAVRVGVNGGSGGGAGGYAPKLGGAGAPPQGYNGGACTGPGDGGGGGSGEPGYDGKSGNGGKGQYFEQFASVGGYPAGWFAGGGGASGDKRNGWRVPSAAGGVGGLGGGGNGQAADSAVLPAVYNGVANTGGGGGGPAGSTPTYGAGTTFTSGAGGSGIVIVRYPGPQRAIGGAVTRVDNHTIHTFTTVGSSTFTPLAILANGSTITGITNQVNNGFFGTPSGNPTYNNGSFVFNGSNNISVGSLGTGYNDFTVEIWFKSDSVTNYRNPIDCNWGSGNVGPRLEQNSLGNLVWVTGSSQSSYEFRTVIASGMSSTPVHCAVITKSGTTISSFYNGNLVQSAAATYTHPGYFNSVEIGRGFSTSAERWFIGNIHSVKIYNRGLTTVEVKQNFDALRGRFGI